MLDTRITGGSVLDGTGRSAQRQDVGIKQGRIVAVGDLTGREARNELDAGGCLVTPGFIDVHSHSDAYLFLEPDAPSKIYQGVTTEIVGNCGASAAPLYGDYRMPSDWAAKTYPVRWQSVSDYRACFEQVVPALNAGLLVGHNTLRAGAMGYENRKADASDRRLMRERLEQALDQGALGMSSGLLYPPGVFSDSSEVHELAECVARVGGLYTSHMRNEGDRLLEALDEFLTVGRQTGVRLEISHLKASGPQNWHKLDAVFKAVEQAQRDGVAVAADRYPYTASCTDLDVIFPAWAEEGGREAILARLRDPAQRARIREEILAERDDGYWDRVCIGQTVHPEHTPFRGQSVRTVAKALGVAPIDAVLQLLDADDLQTGGIFFGMSEENLWRVLGKPWVMLGSDASIRALTGPLSEDFPHPRAYGSFSLFLREALEGRMPVEEAVRKMTSLPAEHFGLKGRGRIEEGCKADVLVIDPSHVRATADYGQPHQLAEGIRAVIVNGVLTMRDGQITGQRGGCFLARD